MDIMVRNVLRYRMVNVAKHNPAALDKVRAIIARLGGHITQIDESYPHAWVVSYEFGGH